MSLCPDCHRTPSKDCCLVRGLKEFPACHCGAQPVAEVDGDFLCQSCADKWARGERLEAHP